MDRIYDEGILGQIMTDNNEPAFPQTIDDMGTLRSVTQGLSKREWFAGMALQGILANPGYQGVKIKSLVKHCLMQADTMLKASKELK